MATFAANKLAAIVGSTVQAATSGRPSPPPPQQWTSRFTQLEDPSTWEDICLGCIMCPFGAARAKTWADRSNGLFNILCVSPCYSHSFVRHQYNIVGTCGDDLGYSVFCPCFTSRRILTEGRLRGYAPFTEGFGTEEAEWSSPLFACGAVDFFTALCLPCLMGHDIRRNLQPQADSLCFDCLCLNPISMYGQVRHSYGIKSDLPFIEDCCLPVVCCPCALSRADRHSRAKPNPSHLPGGSMF